MIEIMPGLPQWEPAGTLYDAWRRAAGLQALMAPSWDELPDHARKPWLLVAQGAKEYFDEFSDDLVRQIDQMNTVVRESVTVVQWENILRKLAEVDGEAPKFKSGDQVHVGLGHSPFVVKAASRVPGESEWHYTLVGTSGVECTSGVEFTTPVPESELARIPIPFDRMRPPECGRAGDPRTDVGDIAEQEDERLQWDADDMTELPADIGDIRRVNARIDCLQREVAHQLTELWKMVASEVAHSRPSISAVTDYYNSVWGCLKQADDEANKEFERAQ